MYTVILNSDTMEDLYQAAKLLREGETVAFPTDTVFGLGADAQNDTAVQKIYKAKGRPSEKPLIILIHNKAQLQQLVEQIPDAAQTLIDVFWPGPLTLVLPLKKDAVSDAVTRGKTTIGVRMPNHPTALKLLELANIPVAAPSANLSGNPSPITADEVAKDLNGRIAAIVSGSVCNIGQASTILDLSNDVPIILRQGAITATQLEQVLGITIKE